MNKRTLRFAQLSAAVLAGLYGMSAAHSQTTTLTWDPTQSTPPGDGSGSWDTISNNWYNSTSSTVGTWSNTGDTNGFFSAQFGAANGPQSTAVGTADFVTLTTPITAQDIILGTGQNTSQNLFYSFLDNGDGNEQLTLNGNLVKATAVGESTFQLSSAINLTAGQHTVAIQDTPGAVPELSMDFGTNFDNALGGPGQIVMNNAAYGYPQWGTFVLNTDNTYSGGTLIESGAITANASNALGTGTCVISNQGVLEFGGDGTTQPATLNVTTPIVITRNTYTGANFSDYADALMSTNSGAGSGAVLNLNGPLVVDSTNAQIGAYTSDIVINNLQQGPDVTNGVLTLDGDFAGYVTLTGNNENGDGSPVLGGGINLIGGVELNVSTLANLGGPNATLDFNGSGTFHPVGGLITNFGTLNVNYATFQGGIDVDSGSTFTIGENLGSTSLSYGSIGMRGAGTMILSGTDWLGGSTFWDGWSAAPNGNTTVGGVVDITGSVTLGSIHLRSPTVNITGTLETYSGYDSLGQDSTGTNGGPDKATVNITGNGQFIENSGDNFNISDNANTSATVNISGNGLLQAGGQMWLSKSSGGSGTINQSGGSIVLTWGGNFGFVLGDGRGTGSSGTSPMGTYNLSAGSFTGSGEIYVGEGNGGKPGEGVWNQTGGTVNFSNWFVVGRENAQGNVTVSGGTFTKTGNNGANISIGEGSALSTFTVENTGVVTDEASDDFIVGNNGGDNGQLNVLAGSGGGLDPSVTITGQMWIGNADANGTVNVGSLSDPVGAAPSLTVNNWLAVGRGNGDGGDTATGTLNLYDGSVTQQGTAYLDIAGDNGNVVKGTVNVYGGTLTALNTWIGENGNDLGTLNMNGGNASLGAVEMALGNTATGIINLNGGTLSALNFTAQNNGGTGPADIYFNGGTLTAPVADPSADSTNFIGAKVTTIVSAGGAIVNPNGNTLIINSALTHNSSVTTDGGLTINGTGTVQLGTPSSHLPLNTYNGGTTVNGGTLIIATAGALPSGSNVANKASFVVGANSTAGNVSGAGATTINSGTLLTAAAFTQGKLIDNGSAQINGSGTIGLSGLGAITGTGTVTLGTGSSGNTIALATGSGGSTIGGLVINAGSTLNIINNHLFIDYGSGPDPISSIAALIKQGYDNGTWAGTGITSSMAAANSASYGIGYSDSADLNNPANLPTDTIEVAYTLLGDANLDGKVNGADFTLMAANFNDAVTNGWDEGDFNYDGAVNGSDFVELADNFNQFASQSAVTAADVQALDNFAAANGISLASVPEPASLSVLALGGLCALRRRRRKV